MNDYNIEEIKAEFWEKIRPKTQEELENEEMVLKVKAHFDKLIDDLLNEDVVYTCNLPRQSKAKYLMKIKKEMDDFMLGLNNANN